MVRSNLCDYSNAYILVNRTIKVLNTAAAGATVNNTKKKLMFKNIFEDVRKFLSIL